jgi:hypothetical protein
VADADAARDPNALELGVWSPPRFAPAYLYRGAQVGSQRVGETDLTLITAYPLPKD